jgi:hypothetical protein
MGIPKDQRPILPLPDWLTERQPNSPTKPDSPLASSEQKALLFTQYELFFPRILESLYEGATLKNAIRALPVEVAPGAFMAWLKKDARRAELYKEAKELRTEAWEGKILEHATGMDEDGDVLPEDIARSRLIVDTYKWLMGADNRKQYGDTKTIEMSTTISITTALAQAHGRIIDVEAMELDEPQRMIGDGGNGQDDDGRGEDE